MNPCLTVVTLGVSDLARARKFYEDGLGFRVSSSSNEHIIFLRAGGVALGLFDRESLAKDAQLPAAGSGFGGITLARNVGNKAEVDQALAAAQKAGGRILKPAEEVFWGGYSGYFADPDGHPWEVAFNPHWTLSPEGLIELPE